MKVKLGKFFHVESRFLLQSLVVIAISPSRTRKMRIRLRFAVSLLHRSSKERLIGAKEENEAG